MSAAYTSQECAVCGYIHPANRRSPSLFVCGKCDNTDNADHNASLVIKKRAITLILDSGTELSAADVLTTAADIGRGRKRKTGRVKSSASSSQRSVQKRKGCDCWLHPWKLAALAA
ncbi:zinc ribbon domain-containing protein [Aeromonas fluvialis]|uniref:zinc ribbon domain-containing protein n=1 Tax=Aeromonas fluvialis TaxID=591962 RepID=UPI0009FFC76A|nr:zinc ribbon domain-containing protein [Aeromonas fluvialis]